MIDCLMIATWVTNVQVMNKDTKYFNLSSNTGYILSTNTQAHRHTNGHEHTNKQTHKHTHGHKHKEDWYSWTNNWRENKCNKWEDK